MKSNDNVPRWEDDPPPGFMADGTDLITPVGDPIKSTEPKIVGPDGKRYSVDEYELIFGPFHIDSESASDDDDLSDLDDLVALADDAAKSTGM